MSGLVPSNQLSTSNIGATSPQGVNSTNTPLAAGATFTGTAEQNNYPEVLVAVVTDQAGMLYAEFSKDGVNWDSSIGFSVAASTNEIHRLVKASRYFRTRFTNSSASPQSYFRLTTYYGDFPQLTSALNSTVQQDADAAIVRNVSEETTISQGLFQGYSIVNKFGRNPNIASGSVPEDIWNGSTTYPGFPTGSPEQFEIVLSSGSDIGGTVTFQYLASSTSTAYQTATIVTTGANTLTGVTGYRVHTAQFLSGSATAFNVGTVTIRHATTTANVFCVMPIGTGQTYVSGYTVPFGSIGYVRRLFCRVYNNTAGSVEGGLWVRTAGASPRIRRPFSASNTDGFEEQPYGGLTVPAQSDIVVRITAATATVTVIAGYDLILVRQ